MEETNGAIDSQTLRLVDPSSVKEPDLPFNVCVNEYGFYSVPRHFRKREVPKILAAGEVYEPATLKLMQRFTGQGDIVSGGAFVGDFFPALSRALAPGRVLHSFEPNPETYASALHTIALNGLENISLSQVAIGAEAGILPMQTVNDANRALAAGARIVAQRQEGKTIDVEMTTLDTLIPSDREISILHLDIEGQEKPALTGAKSLITRWRPMIIVEAAKMHVRKEYARFLRSTFPELGYGPSGAIERNIVFLPGLD